MLGTQERTGLARVFLGSQPIRTPADFQAVARTLNPGAPVLMRVQRGDVVLYVVINAAR